MGNCWSRNEAQLLYMFCKLSEPFPSYQSPETCVLGQMVGICLDTFFHTKDCLFIMYCSQI